MKKILTFSILAAFGLQSAVAHRAWILPSSTVLSGDGSWVTFDLCASNNIFFVNHRPIPADSVSAIAPDGEVLEVQNAAEGHLRTTFDLELKQEGTYRVGVIRQGMMAFWKEGEENKRLRGTKEELTAQAVTKKEGVRLSEGDSAIITYVTLGKPSAPLLQPSGKGLEVIFVDSHPNDLFANEATALVFHLNGKPAANLDVVVIKDGDRFRNDPGEVTLTTNEKGECSVTWTEAGRYWLNAEIESEGEPFEGLPVKKSASIALTLEVLPE